MPRPAPTEAPQDTAIFVSAKDAAHMLGLSRNEMYDLLNKQVIESRYHGKRRLVLLASVHAFADALPTERSA